MQQFFRTLHYSAFNNKCVRNNNKKKTNFTTCFTCAGTQLRRPRLLCLRVGNLSGNARRIRKWCVRIRRCAYVSHVDSLTNSKTTNTIILAYLQEKTRIPLIQLIITQRKKNMPILLLVLINQRCESFTVQRLINLFFFSF